LSQNDYAQNFNAVDLNDRDSADYSTTIRSNRYYLRIYKWLFDRVPHTLYQACCWLAEAGIGPTKWKKYLNKNGGRGEFQVDLGIAVLNYATQLEWIDLTKGGPSWIRQNSKTWIPCDCNACFFCLNGMTNGIYNKQSKMIVVYEDGTKKKRAVECDKLRETIFKSGQPCVACLAQLKVTQPQLRSWADRRMLAKSSTKGCRVCRQAVCAKCWESYEHPNNPNKKS
jgi:hypothetical protein